MAATVQQARLNAMLAVSRGVATGGDLPSALENIARHAAGVVGATGGLVLLRSRDGFKIGGGWGISERYRRGVESRPRALAASGPSALAVNHLKSIVIGNVETDDRVRPWRQLAISEGYRAIVSSPLMIDGEAVGALNVYRNDVGRWSDADVEVLAFFADHAATAIRLAELIDRQNRQLVALEWVIRGLREQIHEHANRIHSIGGLLALGERAEARRFVAELLSMHGQLHRAVVDGIDHPTLGGLLLAETMIASQRGVTLKIDRRSRLTSLPARLGEAEAIAIVGHLLQQAFDAVADVSADRRRVTFSASTVDGGVVFKTRDWGDSPPLTSSVLVDSVVALSGSVTRTNESPGSTTIVELPDRPTIAKIRDRPLHR